MLLKEIVLLLLYFSLKFKQTTATPIVYYANVGDSANLQCGGGGMACYSSYATKNTAFAMVMLTPSYKYQIQSGIVVVNNVQATDAGFYTCSSRCDQVTYDQISYYLQPTISGQPIDTSQNWIAIPPNAFDDNTNRQRYYVIVTNEQGVGIHGHGGLSVGEIIGLVIGVAAAILITLAIIIVLCILNRNRKRRKQDKMINSKSKSEDKDTSSVDYSTIEREYGSSAGNTLTSRDPNQVDRDGELNSLAANKGIISTPRNDINTRSINGPGTYRPNEYHSNSNRDGQMLDLPSIDIIPNADYNNKKIPAARTQNKVQFPDRPNVDSRPRYVSNENIHLQQIAPESNLMPNLLDDEFGRSPYQFNQNISGDEPENDGGVTVVSARTPSRLDQIKQNQHIHQQQQHQPYQSSPKPYINQSQPPPPKQYPGLSLSHRIETTSTPLQIPISSTSLRNGGNQLLPNSTPLRQASLNKDGATDV